MRNYAFKMVIVLTSVALTLSGCGSDSNPTGPGGGNQGVGLTQALEPAFAQYFGQNQATFQSLGYFGPLIVALTASPVRENQPNGAEPEAATCINPALLGIVFDYNGSTYEATAQSGAPGDGARFLLYEVDANDVVNTSNQIGYLDVVCAGTTPSIALTVAVVIGGQARLDATLTGNYSGSSYYLTMNGTVYDPAGAGLPISGLAQYPYAGAVVSAGIYSTLGVDIGPISIGYSAIEDISSDETEAFVSASQFDSTGLVWSLYASLYADAQAAISDGYVTFSDGMNYLTVACIVGTLSAPSAIDPAVGNCTQGGTSNGNYPLGDRSDLTDAFSAMRSMHDQVADILGACLTTIL